jgi:hypothetical protein
LYVYPKKNPTVDLTPHLGRHHGLPRIGATQTGTEEHEGLTSRFGQAKMLEKCGIEPEKNRDL